MAAMPRFDSTNVRAASPLDPWPLPPRAASRAPALALLAWTAFVAIAAGEEVFLRLEAEAFMLLALFALAFITLTPLIDRDARSAAARFPRPLAFAFGLDVTLAVALLGPLPGASVAAWATFPGALLLLVALPLALVLHVEALRRPRLRKAPGASPGATRAAT